MKSLIILLLTSMFVFSCQKEVIQPTPFKSEFLAKGVKIECVYIFDENTNTSGHIDFYSGENLSYVHEFQASEIQDTISEEGQIGKFIKFTYYADSDEITQSNGWFYVNIYLEDSVEFIFNTNYINNMTALNGNSIFPEPSQKISNNTNFLTNFFKIEITNKKIKGKQLIHSI